MDKVGRFWIQADITIILKTEVDTHFFKHQRLIWIMKTINVQKNPKKGIFRVGIIEWNNFSYLIFWSAPFKNKQKGNNDVDVQETLWVYQQHNNIQMAEL